MQVIAIGNLLCLIGYRFFLIIINNNVVNIGIMEDMVTFNIAKFKCV